MTAVPAEPVARWPRAWIVLLLVGAVLGVTYHWLAEGTPGSVCYGLVGVLGLIGITAGIRLHRPVRRAPWYLLLAGQALWVTGDTVGAVLAWRGDGDRFPTAADVFYLAAYPALALSLILLTRGRRPRRDVEGVLDGLAVLVALVLLTAIVLGPQARPEAGAPLAAVLVGGAYPQLDVLLLVLLVALVTTPGSRTAALRLLVLALALVVVADIGAVALDALTFDSSGALDYLWMASYVIVGAAVLHPSLRELSIPVRPERGQFSRWRLAATVLAALVPPAMLVLEHELGRPISVWPIATASAVMFLLVIARMYRVIREIAAAQAARERAQVALAYQARHDSLTGLPNRARGLELIGASMARGERSGAMVALLFVDLDGFKAVNDTHGHRAGDEVLRTVATRMQTVVRQGDMVGRLGGDEFVVLLEPVVDGESALAVAHRLIAEVSAPLRLSNGQVAAVGASVGVAVAQDAGTDAEALLNEADTAAYRAKHLGRGRAEVFGDALRRELSERADIERGLRQAIEEDGFTLSYLPVIAVDTGEATGLQTQVVWERPGQGPVPASVFRPVAELSDLVFELDAWVLRHAVRQLAGWLAGAPSSTGTDPLLRVGVEVSARHVARVRVVEDVLSALAGSGLRPEQLVVDVADTTLVDDPIGFGHLDQLRAHGVEVGLGDFGNGYSSVRRLRRLPIDVVKLDGNCLDWRTPSGSALLQLMVQGVQNFGLRLVVTGVSDSEHYELLRSMGCTMMQGPYFGPPLEGFEVGTDDQLRSVAS